MNKESAGGGEVFLEHGGVASLKNVGVLG